MTGREQTRRDAADLIHSVIVRGRVQGKETLCSCDFCLRALAAHDALDALVAELEQAERERDEWERKYNALLDNGGVIPG